MAQTVKRTSTYKTAQKNAVFPKDQLPTQRQPAQRPRLPYHKCFLILVITQLVLSVAILGLGSACTALGTSPETLYDETITHAPNAIYPNCFWGSAIWIGIICIASCVVGFVAILRTAWTPVVYGYFVMAMVAALLSVVLFGIMIHWVDVWATYHELHPTWTLADINVALNVLVLICTVGNIGLNITSFCMMGWYLDVMSSMRDTLFAKPEPVPKDIDYFHQNATSYDFTPSSELPSPYSPYHGENEWQISETEEEEEAENNQIPAEPTPDPSPLASYVVRGSNHKSYTAKPVYIIPTPQSQRSIEEQAEEPDTPPPPVPEATYPKVHSHAHSPSDIEETSSVEGEGIYDTVPEELILTLQTRQEQENEGSPGSIGNFGSFGGRGSGGGSRGSGGSWGSGGS